MKELNSNILVDLHIHTNESAYKDGKLVDNSTIDHLNIILHALNKEKINLIGFSDHNRFNLKIYKEAYRVIHTGEYKNIKNIIPSVEFDVELEKGKPSCHIISIFNVNDNIENASKISEVIENNKLLNKKDFYTKEQFENILKLIGWDVLLIACQRKSVTNKSGGKNCISDSCERIDDFLKIGYINALEYQTQKVEGILNSNLIDFPEDLKLGLVSGSDCHDWSCYPYHDRNEKEIGKEKSFYFKVKCLPTFKGLVMAFTSPLTRFRRSENKNSFLNSFKLNDVEIPLSSGFNVIIGENGSGKSTLLNGLAGIGNIKDSYMKTLLNSNQFVVQPLKPTDYKLIKQAALTENDNNKESIFGDEIRFPVPNNDSFRTSINKFIFAIENKVDSNISLNQLNEKLCESKFAFDLKYETDSNTYYINIIKDKDFSTITNKHSERLIALNTALDKTSELYKDDYYTIEQKELIKQSFVSILQVRKDVITKYNEVESEIKIKNFISSEIDNYTFLIEKMQSTNDSLKNKYVADKNSFISLILSNVKEKTKNRRIVIPPISFSGGTEKNPAMVSTLYHQLYTMVKQV